VTPKVDGLAHNKEQTTPAEIEPTETKPKNTVIKKPVEVIEEEASDEKVIIVKKKKTC
jgi:hypothetical protein